jgi:hypothetical protein
LSSDCASLPAKPKPGLLPVLIVLFVISYSLLALLVVEQGRTIETQRSLIRSLFTDSTQLTALKGKIVQKQRADAQAQAEAHANSQAKAPSSQAAPQDQPKSKGHAGKLRRQVPQRPPRPASDLADERRALISI